MIKSFVKYEIVDENRGQPNIESINPQSFVFRYPCHNVTECTPYKITLKPGVYKMECWGSKGVFFSGAKNPGYGAYTSGVLSLRYTETLYVYVGATGLFNSIRNYPNTSMGPIGSGGATDIRLTSSSNWWNFSSLASRIMVAAGGGSVEWN